MKNIAEEYIIMAAWVLREARNGEGYGK